MQNGIIADPGFQILDSTFHLGFKVGFESATLQNGRLGILQGRKQGKTLKIEKKWRKEQLKISFLV
jgi:hypothetical protein